MNTKLTGQVPPIDVGALAAKLFVDFSVLAHGTAILRTRAGRPRALAFRFLQSLREIAERKSGVGGVISTCNRTLDLDRCHEPSCRVLVEFDGKLVEIERVQVWFKVRAQQVDNHLGTVPTQTTLAAYEGALWAAGWSQQKEQQMQRSA